MSHELKVCGVESGKLVVATCNFSVAGGIS